MWTQMKRVSIPTFNGNKQTYETWKAAFISCIDKAPATKEYKLLQLRQYLTGEALVAIENLGHSAAAYDSALERLDRKYGGKRRIVARYLEELDSFSPMKEENSKSLDKFADLLDIAVINLTEFDREDDLKDGALYLKLQKKLPQQMLTRYHRWLFEQDKTGSVLELRVWVIQEAEFHTIAEETLNGMGNARIKTVNNNRTHVATSEKDDRYTVACRFCNGPHGIWNCKQFKELKQTDKWTKAKELRLCFRCLGQDHMGNSCTRGRVCGIDGCSKNHHRLLHSVNDSTTKKEPNQTDNIHTHTVCSDGQVQFQSKFIGLRTVPVYVTNGDKRMKINALLDDGSTQTYLNIGVATELGLMTGISSENITVNVLNGKKETIMTNNVSFGLESANSQLKMSVCAKTIENVTGTLQALELNEQTRKWNHLKGISFPQVGANGNVDMLIGLDYVDLHQSLFEVRGQPGQPIARLTPLGWTCVGDLNKTEESSFHTLFTHEQKVDLDGTMRKFWEIEESGTQDNVMSCENKSVLQATEKSIEYRDGRYEIGIPWKAKRDKLQNNRDMAMKRLENTEKRLNKDSELRNTYDRTISNYVEKGYVSKVDELTDEDSPKWFLPHFPVLRLDKSTTKVRIVFDASAKQGELSLNDAIYQGPKWQQYLCEVLLRFRRHTVALACDIQEMYLQIGIPIPDRRYHRFLWRSSTQEEPHEYEFNRVVFGVNTSPFLAQLVAQHHAMKLADAYPLASETVLRSTYMDDSMDSIPNDEQGVKLYNELNELWQKAGMFAHKWLSNSSTVLGQNPQQSRVNKVDLSKGELPSVKTLGVMWEADSDMFSFSYNVPDRDMQVTKRSFLKKLATVYDPLGFLCPYTIRAKVLLQEIWLSGFE